MTEEPDAADVDLEAEAEAQETVEETAEAEAVEAETAADKRPVRRKFGVRLAVAVSAAACVGAQEPVEHRVCGKGRGQVVGAVGVSGGTGVQDQAVAEAAASAF